MLHDGKWTLIQVLLNKLKKSFLVEKWKKQFIPHYYLIMLVFPKTIGIILDNHLKFHHHIKMVFRKISKTIALLCKLRNFLPRAALITIYKTFSRPHLDYGYFLYDQAYMSFHQKQESIQYIACHLRYIDRKALPKNRFRVSPITSLV